MVWRTIFMLTLSAGSLIACAEPVAGQPPLRRPSAQATGVDWDEASDRAFRRLYQGGESAFELAARLADSDPGSPAEAMFALNVMLRAGFEEEAVQLVAVLKERVPDLSHEQLAKIYRAALEHYNALHVAKALVESYEDSVNDIDLDRLIRALDRDGWTVPAIDGWLADRPWQSSDFWLISRVRFAAKHQRAGPLLDALADRAKATPENNDAALRLLKAIDAARHMDAQIEKPDIRWMHETLEVGSATAAFDLAEQAHRIGAWETAVWFYRRATVLPLADAELEELGRMRQRLLLPDELRTHFKVHALRNLAQCLLHAGKADEAQAAMERLTALGDGAFSGPGLRTAGEIQAASGARTTENRIVEQQQTAADDPQYWLDRAAYYQGRELAGEQEAAYRKALQLSEPAVQRQGKVPANVRDRALTAYAGFLERQGRSDEAIALLKMELKRAPAETSSAEVAARKLAFDYAQHVDASEPVYWSWLERRPQWSHTEQRLLWRVLENAGERDLDRFFVRAERLAEGAHPSRSASLGWIMNRMGHPQRSIRLLQDAARRAADPQLSRSANFTLFESCLDTGDWRNARDVFPQAMEQLTIGEIPVWKSRIAVAAAQAGDREAAFQIWREAMNADPSQLPALRQLAAAGLEPELRRYFRQVQNDYPRSRVPERAREALAGP